MKKKKDIKDILGIVILILLVVFVYNLFNSPGIKVEAAPLKTDLPKTRIDRFVDPYILWLNRLEEDGKPVTTQVMERAVNDIKEVKATGPFNPKDKQKLVRLLKRIRKAQRHEIRKRLIDRIKEQLDKIRQGKDQIENPDDPGTPFQRISFKDYLIEKYTDKSGNPFYEKFDNTFDKLKSFAFLTEDDKLSLEACYPEYSILIGLAYIFPPADPKTNPGSVLVPPLSTIVPSDFDKIVDIYKKHEEAWEKLPGTDPRFQPVPQPDLQDPAKPCPDPAPYPDPVPQPELQNPAQPKDSEPSVIKKLEQLGEEIDAVINNGSNE